MLNILSVYSGDSAIIVLIAFFLAILIALSTHEFAHAYVAYKQGDTTAKAYGRLTLNPRAHIDPMGMIMLLLIGFGWAKPVPVNPSNFKSYQRGMFFVSIAGVIVNFITFIVFAFITALISEGIIGLNIQDSLGFFLYTLSSFIATISFSLAIFNLIPVAPLDGFNMVKALSKRNNEFLRFMRLNGQWVLIILLISGLIPDLINFMYDLIAQPILQFFIDYFNTF